VREFPGGQGALLQGLQIHAPADQVA
jgi:hypothetical protein